MAGNILLGRVEIRKKMVNKVPEGAL